MQTTADTGRCLTPRIAPKSFWICGPFADFFLLSAGCGLLLVPVAAIALCAPQWWSGVFMVWTLGFSITHQSATFMRLALDRHCRSELSHLYHLIPVSLAAVFAVLLLGFGLLSVVASFWLAGQIHHVAMQQYGIYRRYLRMADSPLTLAVNRLAQVLILGVPWLAVCYPLSQGARTLFWYELALPDARFFACAFAAGVIPFLVLSGLYLVLEIKELAGPGRFPGRFLSVAGTITVHCLAWFVIQELSWGYVTVSIWHCLQYLVYADKFRTSPPPGVQQDQISRVQYTAAVILISALTYGLFRLTGYAGVLAVAVLQFTFAFHHYIADALIWRKRPVS